MKAGQDSEWYQTEFGAKESFDAESESVRPLSVCAGETMSDSDPESDAEGPGEGVVGIEGERIKAPKEGRFLRKVLDPRTPTECGISELVPSLREIQW